MYSREDLNLHDVCIPNAEAYQLAHYYKLKIPQMLSGGVCYCVICSCYLHYIAYPLRILKWIKRRLCMPSDHYHNAKIVIVFKLPNNIVDTSKYFYSSYYFSIISWHRHLLFCIHHICSHFDRLFVMDVYLP